MADAAPGSSRLRTVRRDGDQVTPLELFFDLVFVLALTQCTKLMSDQPDWTGLGRALLLLALLWWSWTGYAWLTSVVDPEEGGVRLALFAAMAALLIAALSIPASFDDHAIAFAVSYAVVRAAHIALFVLASRDDPDLRRSVSALAAGTAAGATLLIAGAALGGTWQGVLWPLALVLDLAAPYFFGAEGWKLVPRHFAERHWLIVIIALGESVVALGVGAEVGLSLGETAAAVL